MGNHHPLLQVAAALWDRTADVRFGDSHLGDITDKSAILLQREKSDSSTLKCLQKDKKYMFNAKHIFGTGVLHGTQTVTQRATPIMQHHLLHGV